MGLPNLTGTYHYSPKKKNGIRKERGASVPYIFPYEMGKLNLRSQKISDNYETPISTPRLPVVYKQLWVEQSADAVIKVRADVASNVCLTTTRTT